MRKEEKREINGDQKKKDISLIFFRLKNTIRFRYIYIPESGSSETGVRIEIKGVGASVDRERSVVGVKSSVETRNGSARSAVNINSDNSLEGHTAAASSSQSRSAGYSLWSFNFRKLPILYGVEAVVWS